MTKTRAAAAARSAAFRALLPDEATLLAGLTSVFGSDGAAGGGPTVIERQPNEYASSFPSEIVTCRLADGQVLRVLCKYGGGQTHVSYGHRGDVAYEALVYCHVVHPLRSSAPTWYGAYAVAATQDTWLMLEYVDDAVRVSHAASLPDATRRAARWIGRFHAAAALHLASGPIAFLKNYDADYYRQWARRTADLAAGMRHRLPWLVPLCERFADALEPLLGRPTVVHGEYTPKNTLVQGERVCPVDWESAAVAAGEIDLASLTDGPWVPEIVAGCEFEYQQARWPQGAPTDFDTTLGLARLYWNFRWLGERLDWTTSERGSKRLEYLRIAAERLGLL